MKKIIIKQNDANQRIDKYIKKLLVHAPSSLIYKLFRKKDIKVNGNRVDIDYILCDGDEISMFLHEDKFLEYTKQKTVHDINITFEVLYEDLNILIVNKPIGLLIHEDSNESIDTLSNQVLLYLANKGEYDLSRENSFTPGPVHRLDRNTSGIVIFGKTLQSLQVLNEMMKQRHCIEKTYKTIVVGKLAFKKNLEDYIIKNEEENKVKLVSKNTPNALIMKTIVNPITCNNHFSEISVQIITGRTHQIRVHLASIDHPVIGDRKYGNFKINKDMVSIFKLNHQLLHAYSIKFIKTFGVLDYLQDQTIICNEPKLYMKIKNELLKKDT